MGVCKDSFKFHDRVVMDADGEHAESKPFVCKNFRDFLLHLQIVETGDPADSTVQTVVQFWNELTNEWHDYMTGAFGYMVWEEDAIPAGAKGLAVATSGKCVGIKMRVILKAMVGTTLDGSNYFTVTVTADFMD